MHKIHQPQPTSIRMYTASRSEVKTELNHNTIQVVNSIIGLLDNTLELSIQILAILGRKQTITHINSGRPFPSTIKNKIDAIQDGIQRAGVCYQEGTSAELDNQKLSDSMIELIKQSNELQQFVEGVVWFGYKRGLVVDAVKNQVECISVQTKKIRTEIGQYSPKVAAVDPVPQKTVVEIQNSKVLFDDQPTLLVPFFEQAKQRGWRVNEKTQQEQDREEDIFDEGYKLIRKLCKPIGQLLPSDAVVGIAKCPIITYTASRPPDQLIKRFLSPPFEYDVYLLFNQYMVLDNMMVMGIHNSIVRVINDRDEAVLDLDKFDSLLHYATAGNERLKFITESTIPIRPAKRAGLHYYCPLCPSSMFNIWRGLRDWDPLVE